MTQTPAVSLVLPAREKDLGELVVRRILPYPRQRAVGPFVFFDHMGPVHMPPGAGLSVRPHPHIHLSTLTYLFEGEILHRDSLGYEQAITPGAINWMVAGRGIVHSERMSPEEKARGPRLHGTQVWLALPQEHQDCEPAFLHFPATQFPTHQVEDAQIRVLLGEMAGHSSPVPTPSPTFYVEVRLPAGGSVTLPDQYAERAAYLVSGELELDGVAYQAPCMLVFHERPHLSCRALSDAHFMLLGGAPLDGPRHMYWNFVSSDPEAIEQAKLDWKNRELSRFPLVPGDSEEFIPLPEE